MSAWDREKVLEHDEMEPSQQKDTTLPASSGGWWLRCLISFTATGNRGRTKLRPCV